MVIKLNKNSINWSVIGLVVAIGSVSYLVHFGPLFVDGKKWSNSRFALSFINSNIKLFLN